MLCMLRQSELVSAHWHYTRFDTSASNANDKEAKKGQNST